jgi:hypothetical protein
MILKRGIPAVAVGLLFFACSSGEASPAPAAPPTTPPTTQPVEVRVEVVHCYRSSIGTTRCPSNWRAG